VLAEAESLAARHRLAEALAHIEQSAPAFDSRREPSAAEAALRERQARLLVTLSRPREAAAMLEELYAALPERESARAALAGALFEAGEAARAAELFASLSPRGRRSQLEPYGRALVEAGRLDAGTAVLAALLVADPWREEGYLHLGRTLARAGNERVARLFLERYRRGEAWRRAEQEALGLEYGGEEAKALHRRARAEEERGRLYEAMELHRAAIRRHPGLGPAYLDLARLSIFLAQPGEAVRVLESIAARERNAGLLAMLARAHEAAGALEAAKRGYAEALAEDPQLAGVRERLDRLERGEPPQGVDEPEPEAVRRVRESVRDRVRGVALSHSVSDLLDLVAAQRAHGRPDDARRLGLFVWRLAPGDAEVREAVLASFDREEDAFVRLWILAQAGGEAGASRFAAELAALGIDGRKVGEVLAWR
jgi:predicted Zn-dependent protease